MIKKKFWKLDKFESMTAAEVRTEITNMLEIENAIQFGEDESEAHALNDLANSLGQSVSTIIRWQQQEE